MRSHEGVTLVRWSQLNAAAKRLDERVRPTAIVILSHPELINTEVNDRAAAERQRHVR